MYDAHLKVARDALQLAAMQAEREHNVGMIVEIGYAAQWLQDAEHGKAHAREAVRHAFNIATATFEGA